MYSARDSAALPALGFPIRESTGQRLFNASPWLIAVVHALHRLLVPRHPPCALTILTVIVDSRRSSRRLAAGPRRRPTSQACAAALAPVTTVILNAAPQARLALRRFRCLANCAVFKVRREGAKPRRHLRTNGRRRRGRSLKTQQHAAAGAARGKSGSGRRS